MLFSLIIPNWNGAKHLPTCLEALRAQTVRDLEVIVVDNASQDDSLAVLAHYPEVHVIRLERNYGFTGACNAGLRHGRGEYLVLLNNDTQADPHWLEEVAAAFARHPQAGLIASRMLLFDKRNIFHTAGDVFYTNGTPGNRGVWQEDTGQFAEGPVFSANGGSAAYRRSMLEKIGLLDDDFYYSCEDVDLAWRAQLAGWQCVYVPRAVVYHKLSASGAGVTASFHDGRNFIYLLAKDVPGYVWRKHWAKILSAQLKITWEALKAWRGEAARARLRGQWAGLLNLPKMLTKRRAVQASQVVSDEYIESILTK
ncbi:MAG: glycosyltransferase family 2 protein [Anaerolineales bacterium]|nr:glycosyltransferase family 2 protein [Anaerolineales bacterium]